MPGHRLTQRLHRPDAMKDPFDLKAGRMNIKRKKAPSRKKGVIPAG